MILGLVFMITGCENFGLSDEAGFGQLLVSEVTLTDATVVNDAVVKIGDVEGTVGELINVPAGTYDVTVTTVINGLNYGATIPGIVIETGKTNIIENTVIDVLSNAWKFIFDPAAYGLEGTTFTEVHLVGDLPLSTWDIADTETYALREMADGTWIGIFDVEEGKEFKFAYNNPADWSTNQYVGADGTPGGPNFVVGGGDETQAVLAWKFIFDPAVYGLEGTTFTEVHLVGDFPLSTWDIADTTTYPLIERADGTWTAIFEVEEGKEFKFAYNNPAGDWSDNQYVGADGTPGGPNFVVGASESVTTQNF
jgi:hypothetical protein